MQINNYHTLRYDRNRKGGWVACYARNDLSYAKKVFFPKKN